MHSCSWLFTLRTSEEHSLDHVRKLAGKVWATGGTYPGFVTSDSRRWTSRGDGSLTQG
jgi:hypothetical protein